MKRHSNEQTTPSSDCTVRQDHPLYPLSFCCSLHPLINYRPGSLYTKNVERAIKFAKFLEAGAVGLNCSAPTQGLDMPVSGWKQSGIGSEMHMYGVENYLQTKAVYMKYEDVAMH